MRLAQTRSAPPDRVPPHRRFHPATRLAVAASRPAGLYDGEPEQCRRSLRRFLPVMLQLLALVAVVRVYRLDPPRGLTLAMIVAAAALPIHYLLPMPRKKPFFVLASIVGMAWIFGTAATLAVLPIAAGLIGLCSSRLPWRWKAIGCAAAALLLGSARAGSIDLGLPDPALPILGTMFMFRMIIFLYESKHARGAEPPADAFSYFFLLPNYCFLHFPVVDYRTMQRGYFADDVHAIQRDGLRMMGRGVAHLLLYRLIYHEGQALLRPELVDGPARLATYMVLTYLLYLHVSGQFHVACGMLHLFGFKLPETHRRFLLATGFTDYWRRINIYWKDFMVRVVFNPVAFRLKRRPRWQALAAASAVVFVATWALHAYQSFWLGGRWDFSAPDALFWGILGVLVMINVQLDARRPPRPRSSPAPSSPWAAARAGLTRAAKVAGTFATICLLWSLWSSPSVGDWLDLLRRGLWPS